MLRRQFLAATAAAGIAQQRRRNIVFILADDHRYDMIGGLGHPWLKGHTPHLDRLLRDGVHFRNAFVTTSLCSPSRASILTGRYMHAHGVTDNFTPLDPKLPAFPQLLQSAGYRTGFFGKWHMGGDSDQPQPGFDEWLSFRGQGEYADPEVNRNGRREKRKGYTTEVLTNEARKFVADNAAGPFCLYLSHKAVHAPFQPLERHANLFEGLPVPRPRTMEVCEEFYAEWPEWVRRRRPTRHGVDGAIGGDLPFDELYRRYCQCLIGIDDSVGQVLNELENAKLLNDTLVVYMGDNGYMWGEHGLIDKRAMYESSIRVPLIAHCPSLFGSNHQTDAMVLNLDLAPTFLSLAGVRVPSSVQGRSWLEVAGGRTPADWRRDFIYEYAWEQDFPYTPHIIGLRNETHSLMSYPGTWDIPELYDIRADPEQSANLLAGARIGPRMRGRYAHHIADPQVRKTVESMQSRLAASLAQTGGDPRLAGKIGENDRFAF
jgi:N-acetylglucosamine-6-sulfatase